MDGMNGKLTVHGTPFFFELFLFFSHTFHFFFLFSLRLLRSHFSPLQARGFFTVFHSFLFLFLFLTFLSSSNPLILPCSSAGVAWTGPVYYFLFLFVCFSFPFPSGI